MKQLRTIWHSTQSMNDFIEMLKCYQIKYILDVRSTPYSQRAEQFNKENLQKELSKTNITYLWFGKEFWARYDDKNMLDKFDAKWTVSFQKVTASNTFQSWVQRLEKWIEKNDGRLCLMCTEANPLECHRFSMISNYLVNQKGGFDIRHIIRENNEIIDKSHQELEHLMLKTYQRKYKLQVDMFVLPTMHDVIKKAYQIKNKEIWY